MYGGSSGQRCGCGAGCDTALLVGPWTHTSALSQGWPEVFGQTLAWLRAYLCDDDSGPRSASVRVHVGGADAWRDLPRWPPPTTSRRWYLHDDGKLDPLAPGTGRPLTSRYDPADPTPSLGGASLSTTAGSRGNAALEARDDVLVFTSAPLAEPIEILGPVTAELRVGVSTGHGDVFVRFCDVDRRGRSRNVCDGLARLKFDGGIGPAEVTVTTDPTAHRFPAGHRMRLQVSGGAHPRFARNTGTAQPFATTTRLVPTDITIHHPSAVVLPIARDDEPRLAEQAGG